MPVPLTFARLTQVDPNLITAHMRDPRLAIHMPLMPDSWSDEQTVSFVQAKEACWDRDRLGHWAFLHQDRYVGWGGFQREGDEWDFGLVLCPAHFGLGLPIARKALDFAHADPRIPFVTFLLPPSRRHLGALRRLGAQPLGETEHAGHRFLKFRLDTA